MGETVINAYSNFRDSGPYNDGRLRFSGGGEGGGRRRAAAAGRTLQGAAFEGRKFEILAFA